MVARWLQFLVIGGGLFSIVCIWTGARSGHLLWGLAGALSFGFIHALILACEFAVLYSRQTDQSPFRATPGQLLVAWAGEIGAAWAVFCWRQPFRSGCWPDRIGADSQGRRGVLLIHGFACNRGLWNRWLARLCEDGVPTVAVNLEPVVASIGEYVRIIDQAVRRLRDATGRPPVIVAHSMGGLAVRRWWAEQSERESIHHIVTIGTPHRGTWLANLGQTRSAREMRPSSAWLQGLSARECPGSALNFTCFYSACDNIVFPAVCGTIEGADNRHLIGQAHVQMVDRPEPWAEVRRLLS